MCYQYVPKLLKVLYIEVLFPLPKNMRCFKAVQKSMLDIKRSYGRVLNHYQKNNPTYKAAH
jgi:hypothetical protein